MAYIRRNKRNPYSRARPSKRVSAMDVANGVITAGKVAGALGVIGHTAYKGYKNYQEFRDDRRKRSQSKRIGGKALRMAPSQQIISASGNAGQMSTRSATTNLGKKMSTASKALMLTRAQLEPLVYRWNGVKAFSGNGYYWLSNKVVSASTRALPLYLFDLTACNNEGLTPPTPFVMLQQDSTAGAMAFTPISGLSDDGVTVTSNLNEEVTPISGTGAATAIVKPHRKSILDSVSIQMNCWGSTTKADKYTVALVRFTDDDIVPTHGSYASDLAAANSKRTDFFQNMMKPLTFNPIATTGGLHSKCMKVIKSMSFTIQPNATTDGDTDPDVRVIKWFVKMNKLLNYVENATTLTTIADTNDQADYARQTEAEIKNQVKPKGRIYLMIRCTNYGVDGTESNVLTPSFDLSVRLRHSVTN